MTRRSDNGAVEKLSQFLTPQHLRQLKFAGVVTVMTLLCGIFLWYLFTPKPAPQQAGAGGYNVTIPEATVKPAETDKRKIYEQEQYKLARKYLGGGTAADEEAGPTKQRRDSRLSVMQPVREGEVEASTLDPRADFAVERNLGFLTAAGGVAHADIPTVKACVAQTQVIRAGSTVQLRLLEAVRIDDTVIPRNTPLYGLATISGMRLQVIVSSVEYGGRIFAVEAVAYDLDGQPGLNVPNSRERTALKEALASVGQTAGTSVNVTRSAGQQVLSELARGGLQASSQYVAGKLREVKITLKANHQLLLISKQQ